MEWHDSRLVWDPRDFDNITSLDLNPATAAEPPDIWTADVLFEPSVDETNDNLEVLIFFVLSKVLKKYIYHRYFISGFRIRGMLLTLGLDEYIFFVSSIWTTFRLTNTIVVLSYWVLFHLFRLWAVSLLLLPIILKSKNMTSNISKGLMPSLWLLTFPVLILDDPLEAQ